MYRIASLLPAILALAACADRLAPAPDPAQVLAEPLSDLQPEQIAQHLHGDAAFARRFGVADGLGPVFNEPGCEFCHVGDGKGHPLTALKRFGGLNAAGEWSHLPELGGPQLQDRAIAGVRPEAIPPGAYVTTLLPPNVTGLGYLEAVSDSTLLAMADPDDVNGDGISGRAQWIVPPDFFVPTANHAVTTQSMAGVSDGVQRYLGRFGRKASAIDLLQQTAGAYVNDIGISSDFFSGDPAAPGGDFIGDGVADPEIASSEVAAVVFYLQTLKAPPRRNIDDPDVVIGESLFAQVGCAGCHVSTLQTGDSPIAALSQQTFHPYSDLLLHDMGPELDDGYREADELSAEWRTTPLWGLGLQKNSQGGREFYLHDGRATTLPQAIAAHGGEAAASRDAFAALSETEQRQLIAFLYSL